MTRAGLLRAPAMAALVFAALLPSPLSAMPRGPGCGGPAGPGCGAGMFCESRAEECGAAAIAGRCEPVPLACPSLTVPVCGCDGRTYGNDCQRRIAKASKAHDGACF